MSNIPTKKIHCDHSFFSQNKHWENKIYLYNVHVSKDKKYNADKIVNSAGDHDDDDNKSKQAVQSNL